MEAEEIERREQLAIQDLAATALYHANRLPPQSRWHWPILRVARALPAQGPPPPDLTRPGRQRGAHRLTLVGGES